MMPDLEKVIHSIEYILDDNKSEDGFFLPILETVDTLQDALALLKGQEEEKKRMITWLAKFCRHIDNGDRWLTDQENLEFFKEKMKQQFGWEFPEPPKEET